MADYESPNVLDDCPRAWLCEHKKTSVFNLEIVVDGKVATNSGGDTLLYCTGFAVDTKDEKKLRILTTLRLMEKYEQRVVDIFGSFELDSIKKAFNFAFLCVHEEDYHKNNMEDRSYQTVQVLDVDYRNSLVLLGMEEEEEEEEEEVEIVCKVEHHRGLKMANHRPPKGQEFLFRAWPCLCPNTILWRSVSNNLDRDSKRFFKSRSGGNMKLTEFSMKWENDEIGKEEKLEEFYGCPLIDGNGDFFGVFYGVYDWNGYATSLEGVRDFLLKHDLDEK